MKRRALIGVAFAFAAPAGAADLLLEDAAWGPLASRTAGPIGLEQRPSEEHIVGGVGRGLVIAGTADRFAGTDVVRRIDGGVVDAQASVALVDAGPDVGFSTGALCERLGAYVRGGTDPVARHGGRGLVAAGGELLEDLGSAVFALDADLGWSDERGAVWRVEGALAIPAPFHLLGEGDDARETLRLGLCLRWPGMPIARSPDEDPWTADIAVDYVSTHDDRSDTTTTGGLVEVTLAWRFTNHWYVAAQASGATHARRDDGDVHAGATASGGLGATW